MTRPRTRLLRPWALWTAGFLSFPLAGIAGGLLAGPVDDLPAALVGGAVTGLVVGAGQSLVGRGTVPARRWMAATAIGMTLGLALGASTVGYGTSLAELAVMGFLTGVPLGVAQAVAFPRPRWIWALTTPPLWTLGWMITTLAGVDVETQYTIFGSTGAITVSALSGLVLFALRTGDPRWTSSRTGPR